MVSHCAASGYDVEQRATHTMDKALINNWVNELRGIVRSLGEDQETPDNLTLKRNLRSVANAVVEILPELEEKVNVE